jgi:dihydroorotate dehydrogenase electron transfer subunit
MSLYSANPKQGEVEFLYKVTGAGTRGLATLAVGDQLNILGPLGVGFTLKGEWRSIAVVGRGVGLATLAPLAAMAQSRGISVLAILSARSPEVLMSADVFAKYGATVLTVTDTEGTSGTRNVERLLRGFAADGRIDAFFTCGSRRLTALLQKLGREFDIPGQVALEQQMACGLGMCFCCVKSFRTAEATKQRRVCIEGPVFDLAEVLP